MFERLSTASRRVITLAQSEVAHLGHTTIAAHHIFLGVMSIDNETVNGVLSPHGLTVASVRSFFAASLPPQVQQSDVRFDFTPTARTAIRQALAASLSASSTTIEPVHLLIGTLRSDDGPLHEMLENFGLDASLLLSELMGATEDEAAEYAPPANEDDDALPARTPNAPAPKTLTKFATDLVAQAREGLLDPVTGRDDEVARMVTILCRRTKNSPVLVGEAGVGKTAVVEGFAQRIASGDVPVVLKDRSVWSLDMGALIGGTQYRGDFEERLKAVVAEAKATNAIVFIDEIHSIVGAGNTKTSGSSASDLIKPALARGEFTVIGATTLSEYRLIEKDPALERRFAPVTVDAPSVSGTIEILTTLRDAYETHHKISITDAALDAAARLSDKFITDRHLPDKAIDVLDEAGAAAAIVRLRLPDGPREVYEKRAKVRFERKLALEAEDFTKARQLADEELALSAEIVAQGPDAATIDASDIARVVAQITGLSVDAVSTSESARLLHLEEVLGARVIGQSEAKAAIARGVRRRRAGVSARRPNSYIFAGPTGVGKTELAKALSEALSGDDKALIQIDMGEFGEKHSLARLIGAPPGYVGFEEPGQLTEPVRRRPGSVILLDEIEKAHPDIFNLFLSVLEDGHLTDSTGRKVDFSNTTLIFTTNLGVTANRSLGFTLGGASGVEVSSTKRQASTMAALKENFRPEFLNRIDQVVVFESLGKEEIRSIASIMVSRVTEVLRERDITLTLTDRALDHLAEIGFDPQFGARPLRRAVQRTLEDQLSEALLTGAIADGDSIIVDFDTEMKFSKAQTPVAV